jgi:8-oxo-dGTP pyrophosphatase MutT (NUDIX family)
VLGLASCCGRKLALLRRLCRSLMSGTAAAPPWPPGREAPKLLTLVMPRQAGAVGGTVLLGLKKRGFGAGYYNGFGGKVEPGETVRAAAARELLEESGLDAAAAALRRRGTLTFHFDDQPRPWRVAVYEATAWRGEPTESDEMAPAWYEESAIPYGA